MLLEFIPQKFDKIHRMLDKNEIFPVDLILAVFDSKRSSYQKFEYFKNRKLMKSNCCGCLIFFWEFWMENRRYSSKSFDDALKKLIEDVNSKRTYIYICSFRINIFY